MSTFTEAGLLKNLCDLNSSQQSIQTLSLWLIHHRKHHVPIVKTWFNELKNVPENKKLTFMYLANDVIQNSKKKGPEYGMEFATVLPKAFGVINETCVSSKLFANLERILNIWEERGVYDSASIGEFRARLKGEKKEVADAKDNTATSKDDGGSGSVGAGGSSSGGSSKSKSDKRKHGESKSKSKRPRPAVNEEATTRNGNQTSPEVPPGEPPEAEELIRALQNIENSASSDVVVRERIANLPPEISEISCLAKLQDKEQAKKLAKQVSDAVDLLNDYNARLSAEMEERTKLATMLRDYQAEQRDLLTQAETRLDEYKKKLGKLMAVQRGIHDHLSNLPDLTQLPDVTAGLAPLPSAGDLFNIQSSN